MRDGKRIIDDEFGDGTLAGVRAFQEWAISHGAVECLVADGNVGDKTLTAICRLLGVDMRDLPDKFWPRE